jgi:cell division protein FtsL
MNPEPSEQEKKIKQEMLLQYEAATMKTKKVFIVVMAILALVLAGLGLWVHNNAKAVRNPVQEVQN